MSFFEPPSEPPPRPAPRRHPAWFGPPENELGVAAPIRLMLARSESLAIGVTDVVAYTTGFALRLSLRLRPGREDAEPRLLMMQMHGGRGGGSEDSLRFGVEFADGRRATNLDPRRPPPGEAPEISLTMRGGGGGGGSSYELGFWVFPLPPAGMLTLATEWPARGIELTKHEIDATPIGEAGARSEVLWEDERPIGGGPSPTPGSFSAGTVVLEPKPPESPSRDA